ncbi:MAG TPA: alpha/beta fold hydrolase [Thermoanaerobaculia bacterium]|nr:alpha/beta fold hydrolase [Thermoanaerobaculia bacterium]
MKSLSRLLPLLLALVFAAPAAAAEWVRVEIPATGSWFWRYVPDALDHSHPAPLVVFLHGAGGNTDYYKGYVAAAAETAGTVVAIPKSSGVGWGTATDKRTIEETLRIVGEGIAIDPRRTAVAGHSAGGAYAYLLAYADSTWSAVFILSSPFYAVSSVADPAYKAPIRMYYGTKDPNYTTARSRLQAQWDRLGIPWEEDVQQNFGHNTWPLSSMKEGFRFLVSHSRPGGAPEACVPSPTTLCLGRFKAEVSWEDFAGKTGAGTVVPTDSAGSGLFWFFDPASWELMIKVLDGCAVNGRHWIFASATTNVHYVLTVTDTATGRSRRYENPAGVRSPAVTDTETFSDCP